MIRLTETMRSLKRVLQDWLGITALATRIAEIDIETVEPLVFQQDAFMVFSKDDEKRIEDVVRKGYES